MEEYRNHTFEAECRLLCELADFPEYLPEIRQIVRAEMFQDKNARELWQMLCKLSDTKEQSSGAIMLYQRAPNKTWYYEHILNIANNTTGSIVDIQEYAAAIISGHTSGQAFALAKRLEEEAARGTTPADLLDLVRAYEKDITSTAPQNTRLRSALDAFNDLCDDLQAGRGCVPTGLPSLDLATYGGFEDGNLVIIAARPSVGKSAFSLFLSKNIAATGKRVIYFSLEMTAQELIKRVCIGTGRARAEDFRRDALNWDAITGSATGFEKLQLYIDDSSRRLEDIQATILQEQSRRGLDLVVVDYLGLVRSSIDDRTPQYLKIGDIAKQFKELAQNLRIPVIILCQLNREAEKEGREPQLHDLRDSGEIEAAADIVIILHPESETSLRIKALVEKNRHGRSKFRIDLERNESYTQFREIRPGE